MSKILGHTETWVDGVHLDLSTSSAVKAIGEAFGELHLLHACFEAKSGDKTVRVTLTYPTKQMQAQGVAVIDTDTPELHARLLKALNLEA